MMSEKQILSILEEIDLAENEPVLVKCLAVHNEEDWVEFNLANCYEEFDIIRVVEGAVEGRPGSTKDGHSSDRTLELIKEFPDPDNKIELYTQDRFFKSLEEQKQTFLDVANEGEWLLILDCDEFYREGDVNRIREAIKKRPSASEFIPTFLHFYRDFCHIRDFGPEWNLWHQRIIRYQTGMRYHTHPIVTDLNGQCTYFTPEYQIKRFMLPGIYIYHYGHAKNKEFHAMKQKFYSSELEKFALEDGTDASQKFDEKFVEFMEYKEPLNEVLAFDGVHPKIIQSHPSATFVEEFYIDDTRSNGLFNKPEIRNWKTSIAYSQKMPTIPQWMVFEKRMVPFFNEVQV